MFYVDKRKKTPLFEQLYLNISSFISDGSLPAGTCLSPTRKLAQELDISRTTVLAAYEQLAAEGYISSKIGSGYTVNDLNYRSELILPLKQQKKENGSGKSVSLQSENLYGKLDNALFPYAKWRRCMLNVLDSMESRKVLTYSNLLGEPELRRAIALHLFKTRGVKCRLEQIIITPGHHYSMYQIAMLFAGKNMKFAIENPGYDKSLSAFINSGYSIFPISMEPDGICVNEIMDMRDTLLYLTPSHQLPTGCVLPIYKRKLLLQWCRFTDSYIIEDDYDSEFRYYTNPIPSLYSLDIYKHTIYTGTFSKVLSPNLRVAYMVLPENLLIEYNECFEKTLGPVSQLLQLTLAHFMQEGYLENHINKLCILYRRKYETLIEAIKEIFDNEAEIIGDPAGLHLLVNIPSSLPRQNILQAAKNNGLPIISPERFYIPPEKCPENQLFFDFASIQEKEIFPFLTQFRRELDVQK